MRVEVGGAERGGGRRVDVCGCRHSFGFLEGKSVGVAEATPTSLLDVQLPTRPPTAEDGKYLLY